MKAVFFFIALVLACAPIPTVTPPAAPPTVDSSALNTVIAQTAGAAATQTFVLQPTSTPTVTVTRTPTETPTSTPTFLFLFFTPTQPSLTPTLEISSSPYACRLASQTPTDNSVVQKGADFAALWRVINVGANAWDANSVDYHYFSGEKIHKDPVYDLQNSVPTGGQTDIIVNMQAPKEKGLYTTTWILRSGKEEFCKLHMTIEVK
jgi:hypothetical protein